MVRGRLWRCSNPRLEESERATLVAALMDGRRAVRDAKAGRGELAEARAKVDLAKRGLGERGPVWWDDGAPDLNRHLAKNTAYADWYHALPTDD